MTGSTAPIAVEAALVFASKFYAQRSAKGDFSMNHPYIRIPEGPFHGTTKCYVCHGAGIDECPRCYGRGTVSGETCPECNGVGTVPCYACGGRGLIDE